MKQRIYEKSWAGQGEHGFRYIDYKHTLNKLTIYITVKDYNDWGSTSKLQADYVKEMTFPADGVILDKQYVFECILKAGQELKETYLLPKSPDELKM